MNDDISFQTWICPKCYDEHRIGGECAPMGVQKAFSPSPDDRSYIAVKYRELETRLAWAESMLERANQYLREGKAKFSPNTTNSFVDTWLADYARTKEEK